MRRHFVALVAALVCVAGPLVAATFSTGLQSSTGCIAVNAGHLDLNFQVDGVSHWGSAPVRGFAAGDIIRFRLVTTALKTGLQQTVRYESIDPDTNAPISTRLTIGPDYVVEGMTFEAPEVSFAISKEASAQAFFTSSSGEGAGRIKLTVRCDPFGTDPVVGATKTSQPVPPTAKHYSANFSGGDSSDHQTT